MLAVVFFGKWNYRYFPPSFGLFVSYTSVSHSTFCSNGNILWLRHPLQWPQAMCGYWVLLNVASETEELTFLFNFNWFKFKKPHAISGCCIGQHNPTGFARGQRELSCFSCLFICSACYVQSSFEISERASGCEGFANCEVLESIWDLAPWHTSSVWLK